MTKFKIGILTGGGDAPGLNAAIYGIVKTCLTRLDCEVIGYKLGYRGLYENDFVTLTDERISGILHRGGTILRNSNKDNLFNFPITDEHGNTTYQDVSSVAVENLQKEGVEILIVLGGDGTLTSARDFARKGVRVIGVPKTIDNDLASTDITFGFDTAVNIVTEALGRLHTTAESHHRVIITEVMGRNAGWIPLHAGIAGSADVILLPEFPYDIQKIVAKVKSRSEQGKHFTIIVAGEGAKPKDGDIVVSQIVKDSPDSVRLGGIAAKLAYDLTPLIDHEVRSVALGHTQRGGETSAFDRILSLRYAHHVATMIEQQQFGQMATLRNGKMCSESLEDVVGSSATGSTSKGTSKPVTPDHELVQVALGLGITFAD
ncbi:ATP-dependent 6-phosphofructokinase [Candidatus Saccharibacteria bacterium]|nr:ATP-dependent 6-phosphofructokinase [Candidatus Saccharibacteria bacterium]